MAWNPETAKKLHRLMLKIRQAERRVCQIYPSDKIQSPVHLSIGQEAVSAGVCAALGPADRIYGTYRGHGIYISKGGDLKEMFAELYGKAAGCSHGKGGSMHLVAPDVGLMGCSAIVASTIPVATGDALAAKMRGTPYIVVAFFGDGAIDEGVFFESINFACLRRLPIVYVLENNAYAIHSRPSDRHKQTDLWRIGESLGLRGRRLDGNDVETVYTSMLASLQEIRRGGEPMLLEYMTYRLHEHVGPGLDHCEAYRDKEEIARACARDPLEISKTRLLKAFGVEAETIAGWEEEIGREVDEAVEFAERSPFPLPESLFEDLYA